MDTPQEFASYLHTLQSRLASVEKELARMVSGEHLREEIIETKRSGLRREVEQTRLDIEKVENELLQIVRHTEKLVSAFKDAARQPQFTRLQQRVDAWKGEQYVSKKEFKRLAHQT